MRSLLSRPVSLAYHGVGAGDDATDPNRLVITPEHLRDQLRLLQRAGYRFVSAEEVASEGSLPRRTAVVTFDDGWRSGLTEALPVLEELGIPATFYVCPGWWGGQHPDVTGSDGAILTRDETAALHAAGVELGSHTMTHPDLRALDDATLAEELTRSRVEVEAVTGQPCRTFAYPFGLYDERVVGAVREAGYELAWTWLPGPWLPHEAPRMPPPCRHGAGRLALKLLGVRRFWTR